MSRKGDNYRQLVDAYQVKDCEMVSTCSVARMIEVKWWSLLHAVLFLS